MINRNLAIYSIFQGGAYMHVNEPILMHECALYNGLITGLLLLLPCINAMTVVAIQKWTLAKISYFIFIKMGKKSLYLSWQICIGCEPAFLHHAL